VPTAKTAKTANIKEEKTIIFFMKRLPY